MLKGILNITICPQDDRFETLDVTDIHNKITYNILAHKHTNFNIFL